ncbi:MAG: hypothetical protein LBF27_01345 [Sphingobacterium sp.]|jgi:hypothetical protein|nr:hypothetical protein [Sphingobacterium sp.]
MKTKKSKFIAGITALILLFGVFFMVRAMEKSNLSNKDVLTEEWFDYTGPSQDRDDIQNPDNYTLHSGTPACSSGTKLCSLKAPNDGNGQPVLTSSFVTQVMSAISTGGTPSNSNIKLQN